MNAKKKYVISALIFAGLVLFFCVLYKTIGFYYGTNDDMTMQKIASGYYDGEPDGHTVFIRYVLGIIIASLFRFNPSFDWYAVVMLALSFFCLVDN